MGRTSSCLHRTVELKTDDTAFGNIVQTDGGFVICLSVDGNRFAQRIILWLTIEFEFHRISLHGYSVFIFHRYDAFLREHGCFSGFHRSFQSSRTRDDRHLFIVFPRRGVEGEVAIFANLFLYLLFVFIFFSIAS